MIVDYFLVYQFIRRLATPFNEWDAYKLGIIDERGNILRKRRDLRLKQERDAFGVFDLMILNIKKLLEKVPGGQSRIASYAAALWLIREWKAFTPNSMITESVSDSQIHKSIDLFLPVITDYINEQEFVNKKVNDLFEKKFVEDAPTMNVGSGAISGLTPDDEPGFTKKQMDRYKKRNRMLRRLSAFKEDLEPAAKKRIKYKKHAVPTKSATQTSTLPTQRVT